MINDYDKPKYYVDNNVNVIQIIDEQLNIKGFLWMWSDVKGILPSIITKYWNLKDQQKYYKNNNDSRYSASKYQTYKVLINSIYGITG